MIHFIITNALFIELIMWFWSHFLMIQFSINHAKKVLFETTNTSDISGFTILQLRV